MLEPSFSKICAALRALDHHDAVRIYDLLLWKLVF